jgi:ubiquinone/menaquinone biosynthesis methyltransferase
MANRFYTPDSARSRRVHELFSGIATRYDCINDLQSLGLHRLWKWRLLRLAEVQPGERALDVCCGTGDLALGLARAGARVIGVDFCWPMLLRAVHRADRDAGRSSPVMPGWGGTGWDVRFLAGDGGRLPLVSGSVDLITVGYGLRNLPDLSGALRELHRVVRPGGRLLILDFGKPSNRVWRAGYFAYLRFGVPLFGWMFHGDPSTYDYIRESVEHYPAQAGVAQAAVEVGWADVEVVDLLGGVMSIHRARRPVA